MSCRLSIYTMLTILARRGEEQEDGVEEMCMSYIGSLAMEMNLSQVSNYLGKGPWVLFFRKEWNLRSIPCSCCIDVRKDMLIWTVTQFESSIVFFF